MRFATVLLLLTSFVFADGEGKQPPVLTPEKQIETALTEYRKLVQDQFQKPRKTPVSLTVIEQKRQDIIKLHKALAVPKDQDVYEKAKADRLRIGRELEKYYRKDTLMDKANLRIPPDDRHLLIGELYEVTLLEELNSLLPPFDRKNRKEPAKQFG